LIIILLHLSEDCLLLARYTCAGGKGKWHGLQANRHCLLLFLLLSTLMYS